GAALAWGDKYFLDSLNPNDDGAAPPPAYAPAGPGTSPAAAPAPDTLSARLRARLILDDHGDPVQAEALDMAVRLMLQSPTARELAGEFLALNRRVRVSFEKLDGSLVDGDDKHKFVTGIGGLTSHSEGDWVQINAGYLQTDSRYQFRQIPGTLAHELLGHALNGARAENAGVTAAMNRWRGDEDTAGVTGWLVQAEVDGRVPDDAYCWSYLADPEAYHRALDLVTPYYAQSLSPEEADRVDQVYAERLARVAARIAELQAELNDPTDWGAVIDHFQQVHGVEEWRVRGLRDDLRHPKTAEWRVALGRLLDIRAELTADLDGLKDPVKRADAAATAKLMRDPFFADSAKRLAVLSDRLRALAAKAPSAPAAAEDLVPGPHVTVTTSLSWDDLRALYRDDRRDHPEHWRAPAPDAKLTPGT
ncbi:MAG: hypothetical protein KGL74_13050, partial [Elusimicrobia bacterium]|nr:hypothetical protein [Elusimicrobiota bacterium]